jgi:hypothetical protein
VILRRKKYEELINRLKAQEARIDSLKADIKRLERRQKNDDEKPITPAQVLDEWLNGKRDNK